MGFIGTGVGLLFGNKGGVSNTPPLVSTLVVSSVTDTAFTVSALVTANKFETTAKLYYGLTLDLEATPIDFPESPLVGSTVDGPISLTLTGLLPYRRYFFRVVVESSIGSDLINGYQITLEPPELTDGNWAAQYDGEYIKNVINASFQLGELRDKTSDCAYGTELNPQPTFDAATGYTLATGITISGGNLNFNNVATLTATYFTIPVPERVTGVYHVELTDASGIIGSIFVRPGGVGACWSGGLADVTLANGDTSKDVTCFSQNGILYIRTGAAGTYGTFPNLSVKRVLGRHAIHNSATQLPTKQLADNFFRFNGTSQRLKAYDMPTIGTVYAFVKRIGTDLDFTILNALTGIGEHVTTTLTIGANNAVSAFYNIDVRRLAIRTVTDSGPVITKLNEWFSRDSHVIPPIGEGVLATGIWDDSAIWKDTAYFNDGV